MSASESHIAVARRVLRTEVEGIAALERSVGDDFAGAVELLLSTSGRVVVSGMGKSGHVARKVAATFASTGTPALFVHPAEASHGDLGMMATGDVALVLSNSGETPELHHIVAHTRRFSIPLIGVASNPESTLLQQSDIALVLPPAEEACGTGIVPSTSTTMTLALGDALAIAVMEHRAFTPEHFRTFHPGGRLGGKLTQVSEIMHGPERIPLAPQDTPMADALLTISQKGFGVLGVIGADGTLEGVITDGDLRRHMDGLLDNRAGDVMTRSPLTIRPDALAEEALGLMNDRQVTCLFVVDDDRSPVPLGIVHIHDLLRIGAA